MIGLHNHIKVIVLRNAAGIAPYPIGAGCRTRSISYPASANISHELPSSCGSNIFDLYDPSRPRKIINIMNFYDADSNTYAVFDRYNLDDEIAKDCVAQPGDFLVIVWAPLLSLRRSLLQVRTNGKL